MKTTTLVVLCVLTALAAVAALPGAAADPPAPFSIPASECQPVWMDVNNQVHVDPECLPGPGDNSP
jgi:hypothetical protein